MLVCNMECGVSVNQGVITHSDTLEPLEPNSLKHGHRDYLNKSARSQKQAHINLYKSPPDLRSPHHPSMVEAPSGLFSLVETFDSR